MAQLSISGYKSAQAYWPDVFASVESARKLQVLEALARVRPVLIRGYEAMIMVRPCHHLQPGPWLPRLMHLPEMAL